jgi:hypothetical protein
MSLSIYDDSFNATDVIKILFLKESYKYLSYVIDVNTTNKAGISSMKTTDVGICLTYLM